jgi:dihydroneopterin aldolase
MTDRIELRGLRQVAFVGALPEEAERKQPIEVDIDVELDLEPAGRSDALEDTVDYAVLCDVVETVIDEGHVQLLERLAQAIADRLLACDTRMSAVEVAVRKLRPPVPQDLATTGVRIRRDRG